MQTGGVREQLSSPNLPFCGRVPPSPSLPLMPRRGTSFSPKMRKGSKRIIWGVILTRQAKSSCKQACGCISMAVRVASFLTRGDSIKKQPYFLALLLFSHPGYSRGKKGCSLMPAISRLTSRLSLARLGSASYAPWSASRLSLASILRM